MRSSILVLLAIALFISAHPARGLVTRVNEGVWPRTWPEALEPLRDQSTTILTGFEKIYEIPFKDREQFEAVLPALLSVTSDKIPLRLKSVHPKTQGSLFDSSQALVRIYTGLDGQVYVTSGTAAERAAVHAAWREGTEEERACLQARGKVLVAGPPWPTHVLERDGTLPEYVAIGEAPILPDDIKAGGIPILPEFSCSTTGEKQWIRSSRYDSKAKLRARTEIDLVVDGNVIDLNRITFPPDTPIIDRRDAPVVAGQYDATVQE